MAAPFMIGGLVSRRDRGGDGRGGLRIEVPEVAQRPQTAALPRTCTTAARLRAVLVQPGRGLRHDRQRRPTTVLDGVQTCLSTFR